MKNKPLFIRALLLITVASFLTTIWLAYSYLSYRNRLYNKTAGLIRQELKGTAKEVEKILCDLASLTTQIADNISKGTLKIESSPQVLQQTMQKNKELAGLGIAFTSPVTTQTVQPKDIRVTSIKKSIDIKQKKSAYAQSTKTWKQTLKKEKRWHKAFLDPATQKLVIQFSVPFYRPNDTKKEQPLGVVYSLYPVELLQTFLQAASPGQAEYTFIVTKEGDLVYQQEHYIMLETNYAQACQLSSTTPYVKDIAGQTTWIICAPIARTDWSLVSMSFMDRVLAQKRDFLRQKLIDFSLSLLLFLCLCTLLILMLWRARIKWWTLVTIISCLCLAEILLLWYLALQSNLEKAPDHAAITTDSQLQSFIDNTSKRIEKENKKKLTTIPTGVFIENAAFSRPDNVIRRGMLLTGYIWQRYTSPDHDNIERNFILPDTQYATIKKIYHEKTKDEERICWSFNGLFYQNFDYANYPFDHKHITVRILHKNFEKNVILVPDISAYDSMNPRLRLGVSKKLSIQAWNISQSFFSYSIFDYATNLGSKENFLDKYFPQLYFYIIVQRKPLGPFIAYFLILFISALILFVSHLTCIKQEKLLNIMGFSTLGIVGVCSGLLFVLITSHIELRNKISIEDTVYVEYLFFITYLIILLIAINSILYTINTKIKFIQYKENLIPKLLYWPLYLSITLATTVWFFY